MRDLYRGRRSTLGIAALVVALLAAFAFLMSRSVGASAVAERSLTLDAVDQALAHAEVAHVLVGDALLLAVDVTAGIADADSAAVALDAARQRLGSLEAAAIGLGADERSAVGRFTGAAFAMLDTLDSGNLAGAKAAATAEVTGAHDTAMSALADRRAVELDAIAAVGDQAGAVATAAAFLVALGIPLALLGGYRMLARRQLRKSAADAWQAAGEDAFRAKDEFLSHVSHELRTPLTGISGFAHVLEEGSLFDPVTGLELVNLIIGQAAELSRMVDDLLVASRLDSNSLSIEIEALDLSSEISAVIPAFERYGSSIPVYCPNLRVLADPLRLRHLLRSLLANATNHGEPPLHVRVTPAGETVEIAVIDNGNGVSPEMEPKLFERFVHKGDQPLLVGSVGLGLAVARDLARRMGGDIRYERGEDTRFVLELLKAPDLTALQPDDEALTGGRSG
ncbi:MAG: HAMP domain-containing sensor histidine kinase [Acidimicrobiia bacterium]|nr:HAMP domain-containing sensor histidine kinase [Acidimicrobiia bacterium]